MNKNVKKFFPKKKQKLIKFSFITNCEKKFIIINSLIKLFIKLFIMLSHCSASLYI